MMSSNGDAPDVIRYQVAIPVNELQVRQNVQDHSERQGMWELVHCRSEKEGRPEPIKCSQMLYPIPLVDHRSTKT